MYRLTLSIQFVHRFIRFIFFLSDSLFTESFEEDYSGKAISVTASKSPQMRHYYRRNRTKFMPQQIREMEAAFCKTQYPDVLMREEMGKRLDITESRIQVIIVSSFHLTRNFNQRHVGKTRRSPICVTDQ